jgi:hypothetical protein
MKSCNVTCHGSFAGKLRWQPGCARFCLVFSVRPLRAVADSVWSVEEFSFKNPSLLPAWINTGVRLRFVPKWRFRMVCCVRLKVSAMVKIYAMISWGMAPCCLIHGYRCFGGVYYSHLQGRILLKSAGLKRFTITKAINYSIIRC